MAALLKKMTTVKDLPKHETLPFPLEVVLRTDDHVDEALAKYSRELYGSVEDERLRCVLAKVLKMRSTRRFMRMRWWISGGRWIAQIIQHEVDHLGGRII